LFIPLVRAFVDTILPDVYRLGYRRVVALTIFFRVGWLRMIAFNSIPKIKTHGILSNTVLTVYFTGVYVRKPI